MKLAVAILILCSSLVPGNAQENSSSQPAISPSIGLPIGSNVPAFSFLDQFDHPQSNGTLKGPNGTVLLFFRSADW